MSELRRQRTSEAEAESSNTKRQRLSEGKDECEIEEASAPNKHGELYYRSSEIDPLAQDPNTIRANRLRYNHAFFNHSHDSTLRLSVDLYPVTLRLSPLVTTIR